MTTTGGDSKALLNWQAIAMSMVALILGWVLNSFVQGPRITALQTQQSIQASEIAVLSQRADTDEKTQEQQEHHMEYTDGRVNALEERSSDPPQRSSRHVSGL